MCEMKSLVVVFGARHQAARKALTDTVRAVGPTSSPARARGLCENALAAAAAIGLDARGAPASCVVLRVSYTFSHSVTLRERWGFLSYLVVYSILGVFLRISPYLLRISGPKSQIRVFVRISNVFLWSSTNAPG